MGDQYPGSSSGSTLSSYGGTMSKAQQYEDEKRRITQSCFSKLDTDGVALESYITHCRVTEDPLASDPDDARKSRVIIVAVRKSGRVRVHKARENGNGTFSRGKTWNLDDLQAIMNHQPPDEKSFTVTILKPYHWQANSVKEKDFFMASLLKIYRKYTAGNIPELIGFQQTELEALLGPDARTLLAEQRQSQGQGQEEDKVPHIPGSPASIDSTNTKAAPSLQPHRKPSMTSQPTESIPPTRPLLINHPSTRNNPSRPPPSPLGGPRTPVSALAPSAAVGPIGPVDTMSNLRAPDGGATRNMARTPPPLLNARPASPSMGANGRRPSDTSPARPGHIRGPPSARPPVSRPEDERTMRRAPSQDERFRTPSGNNNQQVPDSRVEAMDFTNKAHEQSSVLQDSRVARGREIASQFRLAANAYHAGSAISSRPSDPSRGPPDAALPTIPQMKHREERRPPREDGRGNNSSYRRDQPGEYDRQPRSANKAPREQHQSVPPQLSPAVPQDPPPRSEARIRQPRLPSRENSDSTHQPQLPPPSPAIFRPGPSLGDSSITVSSPKPYSPGPIHVIPNKPQDSSSKPYSPGPTHITPNNSQDQAQLKDHQSEFPNKDSLQPALPLRKPRSRSKSPCPSMLIQQCNISTYLEDLDKSSLSLDLNTLLQEFGWDWHKKVDELQLDVKKELARVESSNVTINVDGDGRVEQLSALLDKAVEECEAMDGLLTLYAVELTSVMEDIAHIENQSQGLQLQTANQKTLQKELQSLLDTVAISPALIGVLRHGSMESQQGIQEIEQTLVALYKAMKIIDPNYSHDASSQNFGRKGSFSDESMGSMRALQEKKDDYSEGCRAFLSRLHQSLNFGFEAELIRIQSINGNTDGHPVLFPQLPSHDSVYQNLWKFAGLVAFARDVDGDEYVEIRKLYARPAKKAIQHEIRDHITAWQKITKKPTPQDDQDFSFNISEKDELVSISSRKLTVKKSIARIRTGSLVGGDRPHQGIINSHEAFVGAFSRIYELVYKEQNFSVNFFHLSSRSSPDFVEFISNGTPETRKLGDMNLLRPVEPDKLKAKLILDFMGDIFAFLFQDLQNMIDWATVLDPVQGIGIMYALEQKLELVRETDQEFLLSTLQKLHERLVGHFLRFLDEQVRTIDETKVKIKKRKGVIGFMRVFPGFVARIEEQIPEGGLPEALNVREMVNEGYKRINNAMLESLQAIAKESPTVTTHSVDPEDKEQLNYHIMMIENMYHYVEEVDAKNNEILEDFKRKADEEYKEHMELYVSAVIRRPTGKLLDFVENVEALMKNGSDDIASRGSHNKVAFKKLLEHNDGKDIKKGIDALKKRVDKHFGEVDDGGLSQKLVEHILGKLEDEYITLHKRIMLLLVGPYKDTGLECPFMVNDVKVGFKK